MSGQPSDDIAASGSTAQQEPTRDEDMSLSSSSPPVVQFPVNVLPSADHAQELLQFVRTNTDLTTIQFIPGLRQGSAVSNQKNNMFLECLTAAAANPSIRAFQFQGIQQITNANDNDDIDDTQQFRSALRESLSCSETITVDGCSETFVTFILEALLEGNPSLQCLHFACSIFPMPVLTLVAKLMATCSIVACLKLQGDLPPQGLHPLALVAPQCGGSLTRLELLPWQSCMNTVLVQDLVQIAHDAPALQSLVVLDWQWTSEQLTSLAHASCTRTTSSMVELLITNRARNEEITPETWQLLTAHLQHLHLQGFVALSLEPSALAQTLKESNTLQSLTLQNCFLMNEQIVALLGQAQSLQKIHLVKEPSQMHWNRTVERLSSVITRALADLLTEMDSSSSRLQQLVFECAGTVKLKWTRQANHQWCAEMRPVTQDTVSELVRQGLIISNQFTSVSVLPGPLDTTSIQSIDLDTLLRSQLDNNKSILALSLGPWFSEAARAFGAYCVKRNQVRALAVSSPPQALWVPALVQWKRKWEPSDISATFVALRDGLDKFQCHGQS